MKTIHCFASVLKENLFLPFEHLEVVAREISDYFRNASTSHLNDNGFNLQVDFNSRWDVGKKYSRYNTDGEILHRCLGDITGNSSRKSLVQKIGILYSDYLKNHKNVLGVMFDADFRSNSVFEVDEYYLKVPREGCAVFLHAINDIRKDDDYPTEVLFTTIHELGHVFNLWHIESPSNFLSSSQGESSYDEDAFHFEDIHHRFLNQFPDSKVHPGGSPFGTRGTWPSTDYISTNTPKSSLNLQFSIGISQNSFWQCEPVELDIRLEVEPGATGSIELPDKIDPGYACFDIMIERPDGTRFTYHSPRIYCQNPGKITIEPGKPFERDISIFGQSDGYTFDMAGVHKIQSFLFLPDNTLLTSNELKVEVKPISPHSNQYLQMRRILEEPVHAKLLYHRRGRFQRRAVEALEEFCNGTYNKDLNANIHYALGRFLFHCAYGKSKPIRRKYENWGKTHLLVAYDNEKLSPRRRTHIENYLGL
jgi:hypothetical protein